MSLSGSDAARPMREADAESLFPERPNENSFFSDAPRRIMAFLLTHRPDAAQIVAWLSDPAALDTGRAAQQLDDAGLTTTTLQRQSGAARCRRGGAAALRAR